MERGVAATALDATSEAVAGVGPSGCWLREPQAAAAAPPLFEAAAPPGEACVARLNEAGDLLAWADGGGGLHVLRLGDRAPPLSCALPSAARRSLAPRRARGPPPASCSSALPRRLHSDGALAWPLPPPPPPLI